MKDTLTSTSVARTGPRRADDGRLLARILETPHLVRVVPRLPAHMLHRLIEHCGLEDCGELVALATPAQLSGAFDLDLWRPARPGLDDQFDAGRFGQWLEVLADCGADVAAEKLAAMDVDLVSAALAQRIRVFNLGAVTPYTTLDGEEITAYRRDDELCQEIGSFVVVARRSDAWHATIALLMALSDSHPDYFGELMGRSVDVSDAGEEVDGLDDLLCDLDQAMFDAGSDRRLRRDAAGYVSAADASAFLEMARSVHTGDGMPPSANPLAAAYLRALQPSPPEPVSGTDARAGDAPMPVDEDAAREVAAIMDVLREEGVLSQRPPALLAGADETTPRLALLQAHMQSLFENDVSGFPARMAELAFLANVLMAGCPLQARAFTEQEASDAAAAVCNLGLENWPAQLLSAPRDLVSVSQVGWTVLHDDVAAYAASELLDVLARFTPRDRHIKEELTALRLSLTKGWRAGTPWQAHDALDVIAILDPLAWDALVKVIAECPVLPGAVQALTEPGTLAVSASQFEFFSSSGQIAVVRTFLGMLPDILAPPTFPSA